MTGKRITVTDFAKMKAEGKRITVLTAYDALTAMLLDEAGIDMILVGDSLGNVFQGRDTTLPVTLDNMIYHGEIVSRAAKHAFVTVDMPFMSFQVSVEEAVRNAGEIMKKTGCHAVKLEGGKVSARQIEGIVTAGIPVMGHVGLTPQSIHVFGGYGVRGKHNPEAVIDDALAVQAAGAFAIVLEKMPRSLSKQITEKLDIPTIGIGAGNGCDGQVLVTEDLLGLFSKFKPSFARRYANLADTISAAFKNYIDDTRDGSFPDESESYD